MKKFIPAFIFALSALVQFAVFGGDAMSTQMAGAAALVALAVPFLPKPSFDLRSLVSMADDPLDSITQLTADLKDTRKSLDKQQTELRDAHREVMSAVEKGLKLDPEVQKNIDAALAKANETGINLQDFAQKFDEQMKAINKSITEQPMTVRQAISKELGTDETKGKLDLVKNRESKTLRLVLKEITSASVSTGVKREPHIDSLVSLEREPLRIRSLLTVIPVDTDSVKYGKQSLRDNKARIVAEGTAKPYSDYAWVDATASIETIAHLSKMTLQALWDAPRLAAEVESEMRYGLALAEEDEILNGDGTSGHLSGLIHNATAYAVPAGMDTSNILVGIDRLRVAQLQIHLARAIPDAHVLNPINLAEMELMRRDPDKGGGYIYGNPDSNTGVTRLWRLPVVETPSMEVGRFLTGAFKYSVHLYDRMGVVVLISTENDDDFEKNKATMRCESRIGLGVRRPYGLVEGPLTGSGS